MANGQQQVAKPKEQQAKEKELEARFQAMRTYLSQRSAQIARQLPPGSYSAEQFLTAASVTIKKSITDWSDGLVGCNPESLFLTLMDVASLGLLPSWGVRGECALVPFKDQATLIIGYRGYVRLFMRSGIIRQVTADAVWDGDEWDHYEDERGVHYHFRRVAEREEDPDPAKQLKNVRLFFATAHFKKGHGEGVQVAEVQIAKYLKVRATVLSKIDKGWAGPKPDWKVLQSPHWVWPVEQGVKSAIRQLQKLTPTYETDFAAEVEAKHEKEVQGISWDQAASAPAQPSPMAAFKNALPSYTPRETIEIPERPEPVAVAVEREVVEAKPEPKAVVAPAASQPPPGFAPAPELDPNSPEAAADALIASIQAAAGAGDERRLKDLAAEAEKLPPDLKQTVGEAYLAAKKAMKERKGGGSNG
jgi:recombinational DNA repair protein RecT